MFKLYEGKGHGNLSEKAVVQGADGKANVSFQDLKVLHQYQCGVEVITSGGDSTTAALESKQTRIPQGIKSCTQLLVILP